MQVTFQVYTHRSTGRDRAAAEQISGLIQRALDDKGIAE